MERTRHQRLETARVRAGPLLFCCLLAFVFCALASPARSAPPEPRAVTVGITQSFPPYYSLDENGTPVGFTVDVMDAVAERAGFEVSYRVVKTGGDNFEALLAGRIDIIPSLGISEKRARHVAFTAPVETFHISLFLRDDTQDVRGLDDLAGRKVAVIADNVARHLLAPRDDIALRVFPLFTDALFALLAGRAMPWPIPSRWPGSWPGKPGSPTS